MKPFTLNFNWSYLMVLDNFFSYLFIYLSKCYQTHE